MYYYASLERVNMIYVGCCALLLEHHRPFQRRIFPTSTNLFKIFLGDGSLVPTYPTYVQSRGRVSRVKRYTISCIVLTNGQEKNNHFPPPLAYLRYYGFVGDLRQCIQTAAKEEICLSIDVALQCQSRGKTILPDLVTISMETNKFSCEVC